MLPIFEYPQTEVTLLHTGKKVNIRPMTIREEKILLAAQESSDNIEILNAVVQIIKACVTTNINVDMLPGYNIEWLFIKLRSISISNVVKLFLEHNEQQYPFEIDLDKVKATLPEGKPPNNKIVVNDNCSVVLRHTPICAVPNDNANPRDFLTSVIAFSIDSVQINGEDKNYEIHELMQWVDTLPTKVLREIEEYLNHVPVVRHEIEVDVGAEKPEIVRLENLYDFFTL